MFVGLTRVRSGHGPSTAASGRERRSAELASNPHAPADELHVLTSMFSPSQNNANSCKPKPTTKHIASTKRNSPIATTAESRLISLTFAASFPCRNTQITTHRTQTRTRTLTTSTRSSLRTSLSAAALTTRSSLHTVRVRRSQTRRTAIGQTLGLTSKTSGRRSSVSSFLKTLQSTRTQRSHPSRPSKVATWRTTRMLAMPASTTLRAV